MIVYKVTNLTNGKAYIGQTVRSLSQRWKEHCRGSKRHKSVITEAIQKYGKNSFRIEVLKKCSSMEELNKTEELLIKAHGTMIDQNGYNLKHGGDNCRYSEVSRRKISDSHKGKELSDEHKERISQSSKEVWSDPNFKDSHRKIMKVALNDSEYKERVSKASRKMWSDPSFRKKMSKMRQGRVKTKQHVEEMTKGMRRVKKRSFSVYLAVIIQKRKRNQPAIYEKGELVGEWKNQIKCMEDLGFSNPHKISACLSGTRKQHKGYIFEYES